MSLETIGIRKAISACFRTLCGCADPVNLRCTGKRNAAEAIESHPRACAILSRAIVLLAICCATASGDVTETKIVASDTAFGDRFGSGAAVSGDYGLIGTQADDQEGGDAGAAYVFDLLTATEVRKLVASDAVGGEYFGCSVSLLGSRAIIGALRADHVAVDAGAAYTFDITDGTELHKLTASDAALDDAFGKSVSISSSYALVGANKWNQSTSISDCGSAYIFDADTGVQQHKLTASDAGKQDWFGYAVAVTDTYAAVGAPTWDGGGTGHSNCGVVYVFDVATGEELWRLTPPDQGAEDRFGNAVAISGNYLVAGAYWDSNDGGSDAGAAYVFDLSTGLQLFELLASDRSEGDWFGSSVAVAGNQALIGASHEGRSGPGAAYVFNITTGLEVVKLTASDGANEDNFGISVGIDGPHALVGADKDKDIAYNAGSAYLYGLETGPAGVEAGGESRSSARLSNHPNPFSAATTIDYYLPEENSVSLRIIDITGRLVSVVARGRETAGAHSIVWRGGDGRDLPLPSGIYFVSLETAGGRTTARMVLQR